MEVILTKLISVPPTEPNYQKSKIKKKEAKERSSRGARPRRTTSIDVFNSEEANEIQAKSELRCRF